MKSPMGYKHTDTLTLLTSTLQGGETVTCSVSNEATRNAANGMKSLSVSVLTVKQREFSGSDAEEEGKTEKCILSKNYYLHDYVSSM